MSSSITLIHFISILHQRVAVMYEISAGILFQRMFQSLIKPWRRYNMMNSSLPEIAFTSADCLTLPLMPLLSSTTSDA
jgi:hypothetical protein